jgi:hypothetical protein
MKLVAKIPKEYRDNLLAENVIYKACASKTDRHMLILFTIWTTYVDPNGENNLDCPYCINNILNNFKQLQPSLVEAAKNEKILDEL